MKNLKYLIQFIFIIIFFIFFKLLGPNISSKLGGKIFEIIGPFFRSKKIIHENIKKAIPDINSQNLKIQCGIIMVKFLRSICLLKVFGRVNFLQKLR